MTHALPLGLAARRTLRLLGVLGALASGTATGAPTQGKAARPVPLGGLSGGVLKQGGATAAGAGNRPR
jgi:hypothetical protein